MNRHVELTCDFRVRVMVSLCTGRVFIEVDLTFYQEEFMKRHICIWVVCINC